jgi:hypothetical protein
MSSVYNKQAREAREICYVFSLFSDPAYIVEPIGVNEIN